MNAFEDDSLRGRSRLKFCYVGRAGRGVPWMEETASAAVLSASLLITGNTVGASIVVIPGAIGGLGMVWGCALLLGKC